jgi:acetolactate synthase-1/2/3 large subunit
VASDEQINNCYSLEIGIKILLLDSTMPGVIRSWRIAISRKGILLTIIHNHDFSKIAEEMYVTGMMVDKFSDLTGKTDAFLRHDGPVLLDCRVKLD